MLCKNSTRSFGMWLAIAVAITAASMSSSKPERPSAHIEHVVPRMTLTLPLN